MGIPPRSTPVNASRIAAVASAGRQLTGPALRAALLVSLLSAVAAPGRAVAQPDDGGEGAVDETLSARLVRLAELAQQGERIRFDATLLSTGTAAASLRRGTPREVFDLVREQVGFEPYSGRVRGGRGALFSRSGNSVDVALLVAGLLDEAGVPWRMAHGTLGAEQVETLLRSVVPEARLVGGDESSEQYRPGSQRWRRRLVEDHWWIEAREGRDWMAVDPVFPGLELGESAVEPSERFAERTIPDRFRQTATIRVQHRSQRRRVGTALELEADLVDLSFRNLVLVFEPVGRGALRPVLYTDSGTTEGQRVERSEAEAIWIELEIGLGDSAYRVQRSLRRPGDPSDLFGEETELQVFSILMLPGWVGPDYYNAVTRRLLGLLAGQAEELSRLAAASSRDPRESLPAELRGKLVEMLGPVVGLIGLSFANASDHLSLAIANRSGVRAYFQRPRIIVTGAVQRSDGLGLFIDLRDDSIATMPYSGLPTELTAAFQSLRGRANAALAGQLLADLTGFSVLSPAGLLDSAWSAGVELIPVSVTDLRRGMGRLGLPASVADSVEAAVSESGGVVLAPRQGLEIGGLARFAWWRVDMTSGSLVGTLDDGNYGAVAGFLADAPAAPSDTTVRPVEVAEQLLGMSEALMAAVIGQAESGRTLDQPICELSCDMARISAALCGDSSALDEAACLSGRTSGGDDPLGLGLRCEDRVRPFRCGSLLSRQLINADMQVQIEAGGAFWGPWSEAAAPETRVRRCRCE